MGALYDATAGTVVVGLPGFEPGTSASRTQRANQTALQPVASLLATDRVYFQLVAAGFGRNVATCWAPTAGPATPPATRARWPGRRRGVVRRRRSCGGRVSRER